MRFVRSALIAAAVLSTAAAAKAATISAQLVPPNGVPFTLENFGAAGTAGLVSTNPIVTGDGESIAFGGGFPSAGLYYGDTANVARSPFDGTSLAQSNYLVAEPGGNVTITFASAQTAFDLLWGSIDTYNNLTFQFNTGLVITGQDIANAAPGVNFGTSNAAVEIGGLNAFTTVTVFSSQAAFEFVTGTPVPEPASLALLGAGLVGLGALRRRRRNAAA